MYLRSRFGEQSHTKQAPRKVNFQKCLVCSHFHPLRFCRKFLSMEIEQRKRQVRLHGYCSNCLARSHASNECTSSDVCKKCGWGHHTLLHASRRNVATSNYPERNRSRMTSQSDSKTRTQRVQDRLGPSGRKNMGHRNQSSKRADISPVRNPKRILLGAMRALERLAKAIK